MLTTGDATTSQRSRARCATTARPAPTSTATTSAARSCSPTTTAPRLQLPDDRHPGRAGLRQMDRADVDPRRAPARAPRATTRRSAARLAADAVVPAGHVHGYQSYVLLFAPGGADARERRARSTSGATRHGTMEEQGHRDPAGNARRRCSPASTQSYDLARRLPARVARRPADPGAAALPADDRRGSGARSRASCWRALRGALAPCAGSQGSSSVGPPGHRTSSLAADERRAIAHRGPDGEGSARSTGPVGLGQPPARDHRPVAGRRACRWRPTTARSCITYNGELYNFRELRPELERAGHRFRSRTDTEVVLHAYEEWGAGCVERFNGMFAFASGTRERARALPRARPLRHQAALLRRGRRRRSCSRRRSSRCSSIRALQRRRSACRTCSSTSRSRTSSPTARSSTASGCCRPGHRLTVRDGRREPRAAAVLGLRLPRGDGRRRSDEEYAEELDRLFRQAVSGSSSATSRSARTSAAAWTRAASRRRGASRSRT